MRKLVYYDAEFALSFGQRLQKGIFKGLGNLSKRNGFLGSIGKGFLGAYRGARRAFNPNAFRGGIKSGVPKTSSVPSVPSSPNTPKRRTVKVARKGKIRTPTKSEPPLLETQKFNKRKTIRVARQGSRIRTPTTTNRPLGLPGSRVSGYLPPARPLGLPGSRVAGYLPPARPLGLPGSRVAGYLPGSPFSYGGNIAKFRRYNR